MKKFYPIFIVLVSLIFRVEAQQHKDYKIHLKSGAFTPQANVSGNGNGASQLRTAAGKRFVIIQFEDIPTPALRNQLKSEGIELLEYIPNFAYTAVIEGNGNRNALARMHGRAIVELEPRQKVQEGLLSGRIPAHAISQPGTAEVWVSFPKSFTKKEITERLSADQFQVVSDQFAQYQVLALRVPQNRLAELAGSPYIQFVQFAPQLDKTLNSKSLPNSRGNLLGSNASVGRNLKGEGVVIGIGDDANPLQHFDFNGRIINRSPIEAGVHGVHITGTTAGAGIINERHAGYAPKATVVSQSLGNILAYSPAYVRDYGMVVTNNSYGAEVNACENYGLYDLYSYILDQQAFQLPYLQHVFAAGNSGTSSCPEYPAGFANIQSGYQTAKNTISVGSTTDLGVVTTASSKGPVRDGRIKPEIAAQGAGIMSTYPTNTYISGSGTSMSAPAVSGGLALLYQRYRQLHSGQNPKNGLMKAITLNGATDKGNDGPDYKYGFGWLNLLRSVKMLEANAFRNDSLAHQESREFQISVPANTAQLKVMLYWNDPGAVLLSSQNLIHNLDLQVKTPFAGTILPRLLDPTPSKVNDVATAGVDNVNNVEQVVINNPSSGDYTISVKGSSVAQKPLQEFFIVYDIVPNSVELTYPVGKERLTVGDAMMISWDAFGNAGSTYNVEYSMNGGNNWVTIGNNLAAATRQLAWTIPAGINSVQAKVRVRQNATGAQSVSEEFAIVGIPTLTLATVQCEGYIAINWTAVAGVTDYEVMVLQNDEMVPVATTNNTNYTFSGLTKDSTYVVSVRARLNGIAGRRAVGISRKPDSGTCADAISDNDLKVESILTPAASGRKNSSSELGSAVFVKIRIKNLDNTDSNSPVDVGYELNGVAVPVETINPFIEKGKTYDHTFEVGANLSDVGEYTIKVFINKQNDPVTQNNSLTKTFRQLPNEPVALPFLDDLEYLPVQAVTAAQVGLKGDGRYDFSATTEAGRIRSFVNSGFANSGQKALTLDVSRYHSPGNTSYLEGTFNMSGYDIEDTDLRLNFAYKNHGQKSNSTNRVWIRGSDKDPWILAYDLFSNQNLPQNGYKTTAGIEVSNLLAANSQKFSSSLQVRWGQWGRLITADYATGSGYSFDDIQLYAVTDDIQMLSLLSPKVESCGLGAQESITIRIKNSAARIVEDLPVAYQIGDGEIIRETIASIGKRATLDYTFNTKADISTLGARTIRVWTELDTDSFKGNDSLTVNIFNAPVISSFPYLENFETNDGYWNPKGVNSSWSHGKPVSALLSKAASGNRIWKTNLAGSYNDREESYLYSPCFEVNGLPAPTLSFSLVTDMEVCGPSPCDYGYIEYSGNGGAWTRLGAVGQGTNWYGKTYSNNGAWSVENDMVWRVATIPLPTGFSSLKLRFVLISDSFNRREGMGIDDIHIYSNQAAIYDDGTMPVPVSQAVSGNGWVHFKQNDKIVASIHPKGQDLGNTEVQAYIHNGSVRNAGSQYYLNRNLTIKPTNAFLSDSVSVRLYFLETESDAMMAENECIGCKKLENPYRLGVSKFRHSDRSKEDGSLANSIDGSWTFHPNSEIRIVPFDKGYYAEMKVKNFSEFWLAEDAMGSSTPLPVELVSFTAKKSDSRESRDVTVEWTTSSEERFGHFEVQVAEGDIAYRRNEFKSIGKVSGKGGEKQTSKYTLTDFTPGKTGIWYYRLKMVDADSTFAYSGVRAVSFDGKSDWLVYPNPSNGVFYIDHRTLVGEDAAVNIYDLGGRLYKTTSLHGNGNLKQEKIDLSDPAFASGLYMVEVNSGKEKKVFEVVKE